MDYDLTKPFIGNTNLLRQGAKARSLAQARDVNTLPDPRTYAVVQGLLGTAPDEMGFSAMHPDAAGIRAVADPAFAVGTAAALAPFTKGMPVGASIKRVGASPFDLSDALRSPVVEQRSIPAYVPPRGVPERVARLYDNKKAHQQVADWTADGLTENGLGWYNMSPLREKFVEQLGPQEGADEFARYVKLMGATSAGAKTDTNARIASYYYVNGKNGQPTPVPPIGSGYGHKAQLLHNRNANFINTGGALDPIEHPKRYRFTENLMGNEEPATVDKHNIRMWGMASKDPEWVANRLEDPKGAGAPSWWAPEHGPWQPQGFSPREFVKTNNVPWGDIPPTWFEGAPTKTEYGALEHLNQKFADSLGLTPASTQAAMWLGAGPTTGLGSPPMSMMNTFDQMLAKRAAKRGESPAEVLRKFIGREQALSVGAGGSALGLGAPDEYQGP